MAAPHDLLDREGSLPVINLPGDVPTPDDVRHLCKQSWLTPGLIEAACIRRFDEQTARLVLGRSGSEEYRGLAFPIIHPGNDYVTEWRVRRDACPLDEKGRPKGKYLTPPSGRNRLYFPPGVSLDQLADTSLPVVITEGEKKCLALHRLATWRQEKPRWLAVSIPGVWAWRGAVAKDFNAHGKRVSILGTIPDFGRLAWVERLAYIAFDRDAGENPSVAKARRNLSYDLRDRGAGVRWTTIPEIAAGKGIDDFIVAEGPEKTLELFAAASATGKPDLTRFPYTDVGNAERLEELHGADLCWCEERKSFFVFDSRRWTAGAQALAKSLAVDVIRETYRQAGFVESKEEREALEAHARRSEKANAIAGLLSLFPAVGNSASALDFDRQPYLLNCANGTVDLETGKLYKHRRTDRLSQLCPVDYDSSAECRPFVQFLSHAMGAVHSAPSAQHRVAAERVLFLQKAVGLSLSGDVSEKVIFGLFGPKDSGKTTFLEAIRGVLGDYAGQVLVESLLAKSMQGDAATKEDLADLFRKRFVTTSEAEQRHRLNSARLKYMTQGARAALKSIRKYEHTFEFTATHKLWLDTNERPQLPSADDAAWERFKPVRFDFRVAAEEIDRSLPDKFQAGAAGILRWAVEGFARWQKEGLGDPPDVAAARQQWRNECDSLKDWLEERCEVDKENPDLWAVNTKLWKSYEAWAQDNGERNLPSRKAFGAELTRRGFTEDWGRPDGKTARIRRHIGLK